MSSKRIIKWVWIITAAIIWILIATTCTTAQDEIPITTSSDKALELFKQGRKLTEYIKPQKAITYFEKAVEIDSNFALAYLNLASPYYNAGNTEKAFEVYYKALALMDKVSEGEKLLILAFKEGVDGNTTKIKELYQKLVEVYPKDKRAHDALAGFYYGQQEYALAIEEYKKAIEIDPDFAPSYNSLGYVYSYSGKYAEAEKALKKYAELIPDEPNPYDSLAEILMKQGKYDQSIEAFKKALSLDSNFFSAYVGIGTNLMFKGKPEEARKEFQKLYDIAPNDGVRRRALLSLARSYIDEGKLDKALEELQKRHDVAEKNNDDLEMAGDLGLMANVLVEMGKFDEALAKYHKSVELNEKSDILSQDQKDNVKQGLLFNEARIALKKNDIATAKSKAEEYGKQAEAGNNPFVIKASHQLWGMIALHEKRYDDALQELQQANLENPRNLCRMAKAYEGKGDKEKAKEFWMKAANFNEISTSYAFIRNKAKAKLAEM